jgi:hypothetical protein
MSCGGMHFEPDCTRDEVPRAAAPRATKPFEASSPGRVLPLPRVVAVFLFQPVGTMLIRSQLPGVLLPGAARRSITLRLGLALLLLGGAPAPRLHAQAAGGGAAEVWVNSELERYLRVLQVAGSSPLQPWSVRAFSPAQLDRMAPQDSLHPWAQRYALGAGEEAGPRLDWIAPRAGLTYNSAVPFGGNDGAVWAGRGMTTAVQAGVAARYGPLSLTLAPVFFRAENRPFELMPNRRTGREVFADGRFPRAIDLPQRFGDEAYARLDPGQSTLRLDVRGVAVGLSSANQHWGPASEYPLLLGSNAPGFVHAFVGTSAPVDIWIGRLHGRFSWGRLEQSAFSLALDSMAVRFAPGIVAVFTPRGVPGLEIGGARFFHDLWRQDGLRASQLLKPVEALWKSGVQGTFGGEEDGATGENQSRDNQLASVFARWVFPNSGLEVYGEFARNDHSWDLRDFVLEPDHNGGYMVGFGKVWRRAASGLVVLRGEAMNTQRSHLARVRHQAVFYRHGGTRHGHTHRGQVLGSPAAYGGAGAGLRADVYHGGGRWSVAWSRVLRQDVMGIPERQVLEPALDPRDPDVLHTLGAESLLFRGRFDLTAGLTGVYNLNRDFGEDDVFNVNAVFGVRIGM